MSDDLVERAANLAARLAAALNVALAWHDGRAVGTDTERDEELAGCRLVLEEWEALP